MPHSRKRFCLVICVFSLLTVLPKPHCCFVHGHVLGPLINPSLLIVQQCWDAPTLYMAPYKPIINSWRSSFLLWNYMKWICPKVGRAQGKVGNRYDYGLFKFEPIFVGNQGSGDVATRFGTCPEERQPFCPRYTYCCQELKHRSLGHCRGQVETV